MKPAALAATAALIFSSSACLTSPCGTVCTEYNACDPTQRSIDVDCWEFCHNAEEFSQKGSGCAALYTNHINCWTSNQSSICSNTATACDATAKAWQDCLLAYCQGIAAGTDPMCSGSPEDAYEPLSLLSPFQSGH